MKGILRVIVCMLIFCIAQYNFKYVYKTINVIYHFYSGSSTTPVGSATTTQLYELENPQAITIEEFAATKERKKNKNSD